MIYLNLYKVHVQRSLFGNYPHTFKTRSTNFKVLTYTSEFFRPSHFSHLQSKWNDPRRSDTECIIINLLSITVNNFQREVKRKALAFYLNSEWFAYTRNLTMIDNKRNADIVQIVFLKLF